MNGYILIFVIVALIAAIVAVNVKFGSIAGTIFSGIAGAVIAHETLGRSWVLMGGLVFAFFSYYCFAPSLASLVLNKVSELNNSKNQNKKPKKDKK